MSRKLEKIPEKKVIEIEGYKFTMKRPTIKDTFIYVGAEKDPVKALELTLERIERIEGLTYEDGSELKTIDLPFDLANKLSAEYAAWYGEILGNGKAIAEEEKS